MLGLIRKLYEESIFREMLDKQIIDLIWFESASRLKILLFKRLSDLLAQRF